MENVFIEQLTLKNFKNFSELNETFDKGVNLIVGINGSGKTAFLEAIATSLGRIFLTYKAEYRRPFKEDYYKLIEGEKANFCQLQSQLSNDWGTLELFYEKVKDSNRSINPAPDWSTLEGYIEKASKYRNEYQLPLFSYYSTKRIFYKAEKKNLKKYDVKQGRTIGYWGALEDFSIIDLLNDWLMKSTINKSSLEEIHYFEKDTVLNNVVLGLENMIHQYIQKHIKIYYDVKYEELFAVLNEKEKLPLRFLSDGLYNMIYLIFDLVWRASQLNPAFSFEELKNRTTGIVLIDEIELHLHPKWQAKVINTLQELFPNVQFFITTHSPTVVANFQNGTLYTLENDTIQKEEKHYFGRRVNDVLKNVLQATDRHIETQQKINELFQLIENETNWEKAEQQLAELKAEIGDSDVELIQAQSLLDYHKSLQD